MSSINENIERKVVEKHRFVHMQHETPHLLHAGEGILNSNMRCNRFLTMGAMKKVVPH
jgi:hypothetical protein